MHMMQETDSGIDVVSANIVTGINLTEFYPSVEWDILDVPARKNEERYPCCEEPYPGKWIPKFSRRVGTQIPLYILLIGTQISLST